MGRTPQSRLRSSADRESSSGACANLLFEPDGDVLTKKGIVRTMLDPACGTGGMLSVSDDYLKELNPDARLEMFGQDYNAESFAICCSDMMIKGQNPENIRFGDSFTDDGFPRKQFDYLLANPPFGVEWKPQQDALRKEHETQGYGGRFGAGLPRINDGSFLFLQHMLSKMKPAKEGGTRLAIVFNGSPLFTGDASSGESEIRRWIVENDWLEAIIALPDQLFYNTGIFTYVWVLTSRKARKRRGKVQLINAVGFFQKMRKSLGQKRHELSDDHIAQLTRIYGAFQEGEHSKIFDNEDFGFRKITVERPLRLNFQASPERIERLKAEKAFQNLASSKKKGKREREAEIEAGKEIQQTILIALDELDAKKVWKDREAFRKVLYDSLIGCGLKVPASFWKVMLSALSERDEEAEICRDPDGNPEPDPELRDSESVPLKQDVREYFQREVLPHVPDAWIDEIKTKVGYEIPLNRHFYKYTPPRPLEEIERDIRTVVGEIQDMLKEVMT